MQASWSAPDDGAPVVDMRGAVQLRVEDGPGNLNRFTEALKGITKEMIPWGHSIHCLVLNGAVLDELLNNKLPGETAREALCSPAACKLSLYHKEIEYGVYCAYPVVATIDFAWHLVSLSL